MTIQIASLLVLSGINVLLLFMALFLKKDHFVNREINSAQRTEQGIAINRLKIWTSIDDGQEPAPSLPWGEVETV